jgi:hypothetical protein
MEGRVVADETWGGNVEMPVGLISDMMVVGIQSEDEAGLLAGAVWVFKRVGQQWVQTQKILPTSPMNNMRFGRSLSIEQQIDTGEAWMAVGAPTFNNKGRVDMYRRVGDTWVYHSSLSLPDGLTGSLFGQDVSINVDIPIDEEDPLWTVAIGMPGFIYTGESTSKGAVFISNLNSLDNWTIPGMPLATTPGSDANLAQIGNSVAIDGDVIVAGAPQHIVSGQGLAGAIYVYRRSAAGTWAEETVFGNPDAINGEVTGGAYFGQQVAIAKQIIPPSVVTGNYYYLVGAPINTSEHTGGQAYIIQHSAGAITNYQRIFRPDQNEAEDRFGWEVAIGQDLTGGDHELLITSRHYGDGSQGAVFVYNQSDLNEPWIARQHLVITDLAANQPGFSANFGAAVAAWEGLIAVSATNAASNWDAIYTNPIIVHRSGFEP